jgi:hypothetical protein
MFVEHCNLAKEFSKANCQSRHKRFHSRLLKSWFGLTLMIGSCILSSAQTQETLIPLGASWRWQKGTNEVSNPTTAWRQPGYNDSAWLNGTMPFYYGLGGITGGTLLSDMRYNYTTVYLRRAFLVSDPSLVTTLTLRELIDDGFIVWINGQEVQRYNVNPGEQPYNAGTPDAIITAPVETSILLSDPATLLVPGTNTIAVHLINRNLTSSDLHLNLELTATLLNTNPPAIASVSPVAGATVAALAQVTVHFNQSVVGVDAADLQVNGLPASAVTGILGTNIYTFTFPQPPPGEIAFSWDETHGISGLDGEPFDPSLPGGTWNYTLLDTAPPQVVQLTPVAGALVSRLDQVEVTFDEPVQGVNASDLLINGQSATSVVGTAAGPYLFQFPQPAGGTVQFSWAAGHGITDTAATPNPFGGGNWTVTLNPGVSPGDVIINEFLAASLSGLTDENGEVQDWIELHNRGATAVNLLGWSLTDDPNVPGKWVFPSRTLNPGEYLVVFASEKDRRAPTGANRFHTNFKLNNYGEYLALFNAESPRVAVTEFAPEFPEQRNDYSYGRISGDEWRYFQSPTPGAANGSSAIVGVLPAPHFSVPHGLFESSFNVLLSVAHAGVTIRYTTDGSEPTAVNGSVYTGPIAINGTTIIRAAAFAVNQLPSTTVTRTYLFPNHVPSQPNNPPGYPATWGTYSGFPNNIVPADYEMDPEIVDHPTYGLEMQAALRSLPVVSIAMRVEDLFGATSGIYANPNPPAAQRYLWERPCSVEFIPTGGSGGFQINCGIRIQGNASREPQKTPKHPFRLFFKGDYGPGRLEYPLYPDSPVESFNTLVLRADFNNSWLHWLPAQRQRGTRIRDGWVKEAWRDMGQPGGHTRYFHLYLNGLYWGVYDFGERIDGAFAASYYGGEPEEYDAIASKPIETVDGDLVAYNAMITAVRNRDLSSLANYNLAQQHLDVTTFIDYMLLNFYGGNEDWDAGGNWNAIRRRAPGGTFHYIPWDGEQLVTTTNINRVSSLNLPSGLHTNLVRSTEYRLAFADRAHKHLFNNGALTPAASTQRWFKHAHQLDSAIIAEAARWGDYRRDVHQYQTAPYLLHTRNDLWLPEINRVANQYFPVRGNVVLQQIRNAGLYPNVTAPSFNQHGGRVAAGFDLTISAPAGTIYYTTNGVDPRVYGTSAVSPHALSYSGPVTINTSMVVKARVWSGSAWSPLNEAGFLVNELGLPLRITEINYNPIGGDAYEFIELQNIGALPLDLSSFSFQGINFIFPGGTILQPGAVLLLANNASPALFEARYPSAVVTGYFGGNLSNGGERIALLDGNGNTVVAVHYDDEGGWPTSPDGGGFSLEIIEPRSDQNAPSNWRASSVVNGTPGLPPISPVLGDVVLNEIAADNAGSVTNDGAFPDWVELHNRSASPVNLADWSLTDSSNTRKFVFPASTMIPANGFLLVWCDSATNSPGLHTGFALGRNGETVSLYDASTNRVDALTFGLQLTDYTVGRVGDDWRLTVPTPGAANSAAPLASPVNLAINEWLADSPPGSEDWIELYNRSATAPVGLRGLVFGTSNTVFQYHPLSFVAPNGFVQLFADELPGADHLEFKLPAASGAIVLYDETVAELERVTYGPQTEGVSEGRLPDGGANIVAFPGSVSPGAENYLLTWTGPLLNEVLARNQRAVVSPWGNYADFVELFNGSGSAVDLGGLAIGRSTAANDRWMIPSGVNLAAGGYLVIWCDGSRAASTSAGGPLNAGFNLPGDSGTVYLFNTAGQPIDVVEYGFQIDDLPIGLTAGQWRLLVAPTPGSANTLAAVLGPVTTLRINEWMAAPLSGDDWFELYNLGTLPVNLGGLFVTDDPSITGITQSTIAPLSFIGGRKWVQFIASGSKSAGANHTAFALAKDGETLRLYAANTNLIDAVDFGLQTDGVSQGRLPDGAANLVSFSTTPTPGSANYLPLTNVVLNEVLTHTDDPLEDSIELHNPTASPVNVGGWYLSDAQADLKRFRIPDGTTIPPGGFAVCYQHQFGPPDGEADVPPLFSFNSAYGDSAYLSEADAGQNLTGYRAGISFGAAANGVSLGRHQTSVGVDFVAMSQRTFGVDNPTTLAQFRTGAGAANAYPLVGPVVINEIMYHPPDYVTNAPDVEEFIELLNLTGAEVPLFDPAHPTNVWRLANAVSFQFPLNTIIPPHGTLLVVPFNPATDAAALTAFHSRYGASGSLVGPFSGKLDNAGETLELWRPDTPQSPSSPDTGFVPQLLVESISYDDDAPWPVAADGGGASLQRIVAAHYGNDPVNWRAGLPTAGRPNLIPPTGTASLPGNGKVQLSFTVQPGFTYQLEYKDDLSDAGWLPLGLPVMAETAALVIEDEISGQPQRFYRLAVIP